MRLFALKCFLIAVSLFAGCAQYRKVLVPEVPDLGPQVRTRNKYRLIKPDELRMAFEKSQPGVFSPDGIPFLLQDGECRVIDSPGFAFLPYCVVSGFSLLTLPVVDWSEKSMDYTIKIGGRDGERSVFDLRDMTDSHSSLSPLSLLFPYGEPPPINGRRLYSHRHTHCFPDQSDTDRDKDEIKRMTDSALAYGVAVTLKEMEDAGKIDAEKLATKIGTSARRLMPAKVTGRSLSPQGRTEHGVAPAASPQPVAAAKSYYRIISCERESGNDFSYKFVLQLTDEAQRSLRAFRTVQQEFRTVIKDDYMEAFKLSNDSSLFVEFPVYQQKEGRIEGRAVVLTIKVASLSYDPNTRTGRLAVKVNANQYEEARKWIRKNIETLARDKNIALTTGEIPPAAKFYLGREELKEGNVLEIEFKTE